MCSRAATTAPLPGAASTCRSAFGRAVPIVAQGRDRDERRTGSKRGAEASPTFARVRCSRRISRERTTDSAVRLFRKQSKPASSISYWSKGRQEEGAGGWSAPSSRDIPSLGHVFMMPELDSRFQSEPITLQLLLIRKNSCFIG